MDINRQSKVAFWAVFTIILWHLSSLARTWLIGKLFPYDLNNSGLFSQWWRRVVAYFPLVPFVLAVEALFDCWYYQH